MIPPISSTSSSRGFFLYSRKSSESEDRQVLSIASQIEEMTALARRIGVPIREVLCEARSAKAPGRPIFDAMLRRLGAGEADGIICWKLDRLSRNPVDGGSLIWAVKQHGLRIITPTQTYSREDSNLMMMYVEFGMAHQYIEDLGRVVRRGLETKARMGWYPTVAPLGYLNHRDRPRGESDIIADPACFPLVRRMWELLLTGAYTPPQVLTIATRDWGLRLRSGHALSRSGIYRLFTNPFYAGRFEYPKKSGQWHQGRHKPMITEDEFTRAQTLLQGRGRPRPVAKTFAFTGLIRCGGCRARVTAEEKHQLICASCRLKFARGARTACPRCDTSLTGSASRHRSPKPLDYVYYHCTKQKDPTCPQRGVRVESLEAQIAAHVARLTISPRFEAWVLARLRKLPEFDREAQDAAARAREQAHRACVTRLDNLLDLKTSPENAGGRLLSDDEYLRRRTVLLEEKARLETRRQQESGNDVDRISLLAQVFAFSREASEWFARQDPTLKRLILAVFAGDDSNLTLVDQKLRIDGPEPFSLLSEPPPKPDPPNRPFEPETFRSIHREVPASGVPSPIGCASWDDVRTYGQRFRRLSRWLTTASPEDLLALGTRLEVLRRHAEAEQHAAPHAA